MDLDGKHNHEGNLLYILKIYNSLYIIIVIGDTVPWKI